MKQRTRIQCIKARTYPSYIRRDRMQKAWSTANLAWSRMSQSMREAYAKARRTHDPPRRRSPLHRH
jgi:ribosome-binding protein aMBF1 (putative translation factor)